MRFFVCPSCNRKYDRHDEDGEALIEIHNWSCSGYKEWRHQLVLQNNIIDPEAARALKLDAHRRWDADTREANLLWIWYGQTALVFAACSHAELTIQEVRYFFDKRIEPICTDQRIAGHLMAWGQQAGYLRKTGVIKELQWMLSSSRVNVYESLLRYKDPERTLRYLRRRQKKARK
jgi:hypothetical protein